MTATLDERARSDGRVRVRQFDADRNDQALDLEDALGAKPTERQLLWIDLSEDIDNAEAKRLADAFELDRSTAQALLSESVRSDTPVGTCRENQALCSPIQA